jgi:hypothetical protein
MSYLIYKVSNLNSFNQCDTQNSHLIDFKNQRRYSLKSDIHAHTTTYIFESVVDTNYG